MRSFLVVLVVLLAAAAIGQVYVREVSVAKPVSVRLVGGELHVVMRERSRATLMSYPSRPARDRVWREEYVCGDGEIVLARTVEGTHIPMSINEERIEFPDE